MVFEAPLTLDRPERSAHADRFVLKGGVMLAALDARRPTRDIDLAAHALENSAEHVLGLIRESLFSALFGGGREMDMFIAAFRIPNLLRDLFAEGAMTAARAMRRGGVGWYPHSGFIHIDTGPVRNWTREADGRGNRAEMRYRRRGGPRAGDRGDPDRRRGDLDADLVGHRRPFLLARASAGSMDWLPSCLSRPGAASRS